MKIIAGLMTLAFACCVPLTAGASESAKAVLSGPQGEKIGTVQLVPKGEGVELRVKVSGLTPGKHGFHIHEKGACEAPGFKSAGAHFNPHGKKHGAKNPQGKHGGDLANVEVKGDGTADVVLFAEGVAFGKGSNSLFREGGTSVVLHAAPDDERTDPSGNSGDRIACGVIQRGD